MWWCQIIDWLKFETRPRSLLNFGMANMIVCNTPFAAKPSRDLLFIKLWAVALKMSEMEKACRKHQND